MADWPKLYRALLRLYPARFREEFEQPLEREFRDQYAESHGGPRFWTRIMMDLAISIPREFARELIQDLRYSLRVYAKRPLVTILAVAALAMAIGATTGVFSVVNALLLRSLPFREPNQLVMFSKFPLVQFIPGGFQHWRTQARYLTAAAPFMVKEMNLGLDDGTSRAKVTETSADFFSMLGTDAEFGRAFIEGEDLPGKDTVAVISFALWQQAFGGDPHALGSTIRLNGSPMTIVGVAKSGFDFPDRTAIWTPTAFNFRHLQKTGNSFFRCIARLSPELTAAQATSMMQADLVHLTESKNKSEHTLIPLRDQLSGTVRKASLVMLGSVVFVLLIACANIANLLLARVAERSPELALRTALGASRARLAQQLITESVVLAAVAGIAGIFLAQWAVKIAMSIQPVPLSAQEYTILDWRVLVFAIGLTMITGFAFGVFPAYMSSRSQPIAGTIRETVGAYGAGRMRRALVAVQVALTLVLVAGSIITAQGFLRLMGMDPGYRGEHVVVLSVSLAGTRHDTEDRERAFFAQALERLRRAPGVEAAGLVDHIPLEADFLTPQGFIEQDLRLDSGATVPATSFVRAGPEYFRSIGSEIIAGRDFTGTDRNVAIVNEAFARKASDAALIGHKLPSQILMHFTMDQKRESPTVIGIARSIRYGISKGEDRPQVFLSTEQFPARVMSFAVRVRGKTENYLPILRDTVQSIDKEAGVFGVDTLERRREMWTARPRFYTTAVLFLGGFALLLAIVGIYGVASYSVTQRTREIGVRMAVGASAGEVRRMILVQSLLPVAAGVIFGIGGAVAVGRYLVSLIETAQPVSSVICAAASAFLVATALVALWSATRRVARLNPIEVLRSE